MLFWAFLAHFIAFGLLYPILFFWASSARFIAFGLLCPIFFFWAPVSLLSGSFVHFYSFGHPRPVLLLSGSFVPFGLLCPICFPLSVLGPFAFLGLPRPNYLILILGAHGLAINPLLSSFSLLWACRGPFSLFHIIYYPWFAFSLFPGSFRPIYLFKTHLFISWACDPLFLPFGLNGFLLNLLTIFFPYCWVSSCYWAPLPKWASTLPSFKGIVNDDDVCILLFFIIPLLVSWFASWKFLVILDFCNGLISSCLRQFVYLFLHVSAVARTHFFAFGGQILIFLLPQNM